MSQISMADRLLKGPVLAFEQADDLRLLRENVSMRRELTKTLSPRHVELDPQRASHVLRRLHRRGWLSEHDLLSFLAQRYPFKARSGIREHAYFSGAERTYLLSLVLLAEQLHLPHAVPVGIIDKLRVHLKETLQMTAASKAQAAAEQFAEPIQWLPEDEPPPAPPEELLEKLTIAIQKQATVDVFYQSAGQLQPEYRRLSPLVVEQRGPRHYLIAYCHLRHENRTFRLDRLQLLDSPPE